MEPTVAKPPFVVRSGQVYSQPFLLQHIRLYGFVLKADTASLQQYVCDQYFNLPSGGVERFRPATPYIIVAFSHINAIRSQTPPYSGYGYYPEQECAFWTLMVDEKRERLCWTCPYIFVDNPLAIAMGREIYGFPKQMGWLNVPTDPAQADHFSTTALVMEEYGPDDEGQRAPIIDVTRAGNGASPPPGEWSSLADVMLSLVKALELQDSVLKDLRLAYDSTNDMIHGRLPMVFLKQFRDIENGNLACYQAIVETSMQEQKFYHAAWLPPYEINITDYASLPILKHLGLPTGPIQSVLSFTTESDYTINNGVELWKA